MDHEKVTLPTRTECEALWEEYHTPHHIREHMVHVACVAGVLCAQLKSAGVEINSDLVDRAALLHDLVRVTEWERLDVSTFPTPPAAEDIAVWKEQREIWPPTVPHSQVNASLLVDRYPAVAQVIQVHSVYSVHELRTWEEKIVHYSDRRVAHTRIVSIAERFAEMRSRYAMESDEDFVETTLRLEKEIFSLLLIEPEEITPAFFSDVFLLQRIEKNGIMFS